MNLFQLDQNIDVSKLYIYWLFLWNGRFLWYFRWLIKLSMSLNRPILICCCVLLMKLLIILVRVQSLPDQILFSVLLTLLWLWQCSSVSNIFSKVFLLSFIKVNDHAIYLLIYWVLWTRFFRVFSRSFWTNFVYVLNFLLTVLK